MRQAAVLIADLGPFARLDGQLFQLVDLPLQALALHQHVGRIGFEFLALRDQRAPGPVGRHAADRLGVGLRAGLAVEQRALRLGFQQRLVRMLAVDVDQQSPRSRNWVAVAATPLMKALERPALSITRRSSAPPSSCREFVRRQPGARLLADHEIGRDVGLGRAFAHHAGVAAPAQRQLQRVDQDRFAGAGLAGEDGKAGWRIQVRSRRQ
jgi:hypothetical protein